MKKSIFLFIFTAFTFCAFSQKVKYYTVQPGENILDIIPKSEMYEYPAFESGVVYFKNGKRSASKLNYNFVYEEILYISTTNDTLTIANPEEVKYVSIGKDEYYYATNRFVKLDTIIGDVKLGIAGFFATVSKRRIGAYGTTTDGGSESYGSYVVPNNAKLELIPNVVTTVAYSKALFIGNRFNQFIPVNKKNIFSFYPEKEEKLKLYLKDHKVNFAEYADIVSLVKHMNTDS
ncbi:hypothetical protein ESA94_14355 [Lacibacter luteus]|uniref:Uncharacterized protein n=1 Tax=Lacibacter luteus TaxID=2508719 RepID=A0A4Q1CGN4_9BACT|nr:hypothetical protein [Lacibacter luteus]RXK59318.1 hypothetical protein ESA94_14355 [Lacibacter luteus]